MPTYEYVCTQCGNQSEVVQSMADPSLTTCEICGGALRKVFHPAGIMFKGSGFYATDNRKKSMPKVDGSTADLIDKGKKEAEKRGVDVGGKKDSSAGSGDGSKKDTSSSKPSSDSSSDSSSSSSKSPAKPPKPAKEKSA